MNKSATLSADERFRYSLGRSWGEGAPACVLWVCLNPSTADSKLDDPTVRRMIGFTRAWGYSSLALVNLFALRATKPTALRAAFAELGDDERADAFISLHARSAARIVCGWGDSIRHGIHYGKPARDRAVYKLLADAKPADTEILALGFTATGNPRHPLYVRADTALTPYVPALWGLV